MRGGRTRLSWLRPGGVGVQRRSPSWGTFQSGSEGLGSWRFGIQDESFRDTDRGGPKGIESSIFGPWLFWESRGGCCLGTTEVSGYRPGPRAKVVPQMFTFRGHGQGSQNSWCNFTPAGGKLERASRVAGLCRSPPATLWVSAVRALGPCYPRHPPLVSPPTDCSG